MDDMDYQALPKIAKRILRKNQLGQITLPVSREYSCKVFAFLALMPAGCCLVGAVLSNNNSRIPLFIMGMFILLLSTVLFGKRIRLLFDEQRQLVSQDSSLWGRHQKSQIVMPFTEVKALLTKKNANDYFQVKLLNQAYSIQNQNDAMDMLAYLNTRFNVACYEQLSDWPNQNPMTFAKESAPSINNQLEKKTAYRAIWQTKDKLKILLPWLFFTLLATLVRYGVPA